MKAIRFRAAGMNYHLDTFRKIGVENTDYSLSDNDLLKKYKSGNRIWKKNYQVSEVELIPEENNSYNPDSIAVYLDGMKAGHVKDQHCKQVKEYLSSEDYAGLDVDIVGGPYKHIVDGSSKNPEIISAAAPLIVRLTLYLDQGKSVSPEPAKKTADPGVSEDVPDQASKGVVAEAVPDETSQGIAETVPDQASQGVTEVPKAALAAASEEVAADPPDTDPEADSPEAAQPETEPEVKKSASKKKRSGLSPDKMILYGILGCVAISLICFAFAIISTLAGKGGRHAGKSPETMTEEVAPGANMIDDTAAYEEEYLDDEDMSDIESADESEDLEDGSAMDEASDSTYYDDEDSASDVNNSADDSDTDNSGSGDSGVSQTEDGFDGSKYSDTGKGTLQLTDDNGSTGSNGRITVTPTEDADNTLTAAIGFNLTGFDSTLFTYIYIDGQLNQTRQLESAQFSGLLSGNELSSGIHKVEVVQFENNDTASTVVTYKSGEYEIK